MASGPPALILAVVIHDSEDLDISLADIQRFDLQKYASPWIGKDTEMEQELAREIKILARHVAHAIEHAPDYDPKWREPTERMLRKLYREHAIQSSLPTLG